MILIKVYRLLDNPAGGHRSTNVEFMQALNEVKNIFSSLKTPAPDILLCGDFNLPHISWPDEVLKLRATSDEQKMIKTYWILLMNAISNSTLISPHTDLEMF